MLSPLQLPIVLDTRAGSVVLRRAAPGDVDGVMELFAGDAISAARGDRIDPADRAAYAAGLAAILEGDRNDLVVVDLAGRVIGMQQLTLIPGIARLGAERLQLEGVRIAADLRSGGIGTAMVRWAFETAAPVLGAPVVQLTSDTRRADARRFYERLGFVASHTGFKRLAP